MASNRLAMSDHHCRLHGLVSYSLNDVNGTRQRCSGSSQRFQCALLTLRMFVVPESGSMRSNCLKSTGLPLDSSFSARFFVASVSAFNEEGMPQRAMMVSCPMGALRTIGA